MKNNGKGIIYMNDGIYKRFADALLSIEPDFPMDGIEIVRHFQTKESDSVITIIDDYDPELLEAAGLLKRLGRGGALHGKG